MNDAARRVEAIFRLDVLHSVEQQIRAVGWTKSVAIFFVARRFGVSSSAIWKWFSLVQGVSRCDWIEALIPERDPEVLNLAPSLQVGGAA